MLWIILALLLIWGSGGYFWGAPALAHLLLFAVLVLVIVYLVTGRRPIG
jgi:hypothetical protein